MERRGEEARGREEEGGTDWHPEKHEKSTPMCDILLYSV